MLVLSRRAGESICILDDIVVKVTEIRGNQVRLAFEAPRNVRIARGEIHKRELPKRPDAQSANRTTEAV